MKISIPDVKSYVISLKASPRRSELTETFQGLGIKDWRFHDAIQVVKGVPYWIGCGLSHYEVLNQIDGPTIVYEDDVAPTQWYRPEIEIPNEVVYLGLSRWGTKGKHLSFNGSIFYDTQWPGICRVEYMTTAHAIFYPDKRSAQVAASGILRTLFEMFQPFDVWLASLQTQASIYCCEEPLFYQANATNDRWTNFKLDDALSEVPQHMPPEYGFYPVCERISHIVQ